MTALTPPQFETIEYSVEDRTAWIRVNRPEVLNAFSSRMYGEVKNALRMADHDDEIDTIAITGSGKAFGPPVVILRNYWNASTIPIRWRSTDSMMRCPLTYCDEPVRQPSPS